MTYELSNLLPYTSDTLLRSLKERMRVLQLLEFLYESTKDAIQSYLSKQYSDFDAQVSENLCQIRAYQLIHMLDSQDNNRQQLVIFYQNVKDMHARCDSVLSEYRALTKKRPSQYTKRIDQSETLGQMLQEHELDMELSELLYLLIQKHVLSKYKLVGEYNISKGINYDKMCLDLKISSKTFIRKVVHRLQRNVSENSCRFVFKLFNGIDSNQYHRSLLQSLYFQDEVGRHVLACYEATKVILQHAFQAGKQIKVIITRILDSGNEVVTFFLKPSPIQRRYILSIKEVPSEGLVTFAGISCCSTCDAETNDEHISRLLEMGFENVILSNMAQHPQYSGLLLDDKKYNPYLSLDMDELQESHVEFIKSAEKQFLQHKHLATKIGCTPEDSSLFLLTHVRCDNVVLQPNQINDSKQQLWWQKYWNPQLSNCNIDDGVLVYE